MNIKIKCRICKKIKSIIDFYKSNEKRKNKIYKRTRTECKKCLIIKQGNNYRKDLEGNRLKHKNWYHGRYREKYLREKFGINIYQFNEMVKKQDNKCLICGNFTRILHVDHCHKTNIIRGLLCQNCNFGLGLFKDNIEYFISAINYLKTNKRRISNELSKT